MGQKTGFSDDYLSYMSSNAWRKKADERLKLDHHICCVCGRKATEVHHLSYKNYKHESMDDIVSLCHECHQEAEMIYSAIPQAMEEVKPNGNNFMAAMREDAKNLSPVVFDYLVKVNGSNFNSLLRLRQPPENKPNGKHWDVLRDAVRALCSKRYSLICREDRGEMMLETISNKIISACLGEIEHSVRNDIQEQLRDSVWGLYESCGTWKKVSEETGLPQSSISKIKNDDGTSFGPSLREEVTYYCALDAAAGIRPSEGFKCLTESDYEMLNNFADYMAAISGDGAFKGEYTA